MDACGYKLVLPYLDLLINYLIISTMTYLNYKTNGERTLSILTTRQASLKIGRHTMSSSYTTI